MKIFLLLLLVSFIFACNEKDVTSKFLGEWININDTSSHCKISRAGKNFVFERYYNHSNPENLKMMPAFYDKSKDKLIIKLGQKDIDVIYDDNSDQLIFEMVGAFKKAN